MAKASHFDKRNLDRQEQDHDGDWKRDWGKPSVENTANDPRSDDEWTQHRIGLTVGDGVKVGVGMFIVLPLIVLVGLVLLLMVCAFALG